MRGPGAVPAPALAAIDHRAHPDQGRRRRRIPTGERALDLLEQRVRIAPARTTVVFLGDNVYETGMPEPTALEGTAAEAVLDEVLLTLFESRRDAERRLKAQVKAVRVPGARAIFVRAITTGDSPASTGGSGCSRSKRSSTTCGSPSTTSTSPSCRAMAVRARRAVDLGRRGRLVVLDTEWWLDGGNQAVARAPGQLRQRDRDRCGDGARARAR